MNINDELLAAYAEGNVDAKERMAVRHYLAEHPEELESVMIMMDEDYDISSDCEQGHRNTEDFNSLLRHLCEETEEINSNETRYSILPAVSMAAENIVDNLCAIRCEGVALRRMGKSISDEQLQSLSEEKGWLKTQGTALHNIGRLSGLFGMAVSHRYGCTKEDIKRGLSSGHIVMAVIDMHELHCSICDGARNDVDNGENPNHVVIIEAIDNESIIIYDPATPKPADHYPLLQFLNAWADSAFYLIILSDDEAYSPHPIDLSDVEISDDLIELQEAIAENAHEVWAMNRMKEGWRYGPERNDNQKLHPDLVAYSRLPESEKLYDREMAINTIKLVKKLGWDIVKSS